MIWTPNLTKKLSNKQPLSFSFEKHSANEYWCFKKDLPAIVKKEETIQTSFHFYS